MISGGFFTFSAVIPDVRSFLLFLRSSLTLHSASGQLGMVPLAVGYKMPRYIGIWYGVIMHQIRKFCLPETPTRSTKKPALGGLRFQSSIHSRSFASSAKAAVNPSRSGRSVSSSFSPVAIDDFPALELILLV